MNAELSPATKAVGFWSAALAAALGLAYSILQIGEWLGWLGSHGGPESASTSLGLVLLLTPSLFLGSSFLVAMVSVHQSAPAAKQVWSHSAVAFATVYATLTGTVYFAQLTWVMPRLQRGALQGLEPFLFTPFDSFLYAVDILGYSFMSLSTLFAAMVFPGRGLGGVTRLLLAANGLLIPFIALQMFVHDLIWIAALWAITFPGALGCLALWFRQAKASRAGMWSTGA